MKRLSGDIGKFGLCDTCAHAKLIRNTRGSVFLMCTLSKTDERFAKYPPVPILECPGYAEPETSDH